MNEITLIKQNLKENLINIGIKKRDVVFLGVDLGRTFKLYGDMLFRNKSLKQIREICSKIIFQSVKDVVGKEGTIICPSYSFSFIKTKVFNVQKTKSDLGYFENFFLNQKDIVRSNHPIYSIAVWGKGKEITNPCGKFSFGMNSPFSNFINYKVKFLNLGKKWVETCTYLHHLEHLNGINHRFYKPTKGKIINKRKSVTDIFYNPVRFMKLKSKKGEYKIEKYLKKDSLIKETSNRIYCSSLDVTDIHKLGLKILKEKPSYFMTKNVNVFIDKNDKLTFSES